MLKRMLVADPAEMNKAILHEIFGKEYELIQTDSSEEFFRLLMHYKSAISVILVNESIAEKMSIERTEMLDKLKVFENTPVILILNREHGYLKNRVCLPYSDVIHSPVNPHTVKKRVQNLVALFASKDELEQKVQRQMEQILKQNEALKVKQKKINAINNDMLDVLSMVIEYRDVESGKHIRRIQRFTELLLRELAVKYPKYHLDEEKIALITSASSMHDIGKIAIPDSILLKPSRLTPEEFQVMKMHTTKGCEILEQIDAVEKNEYYRYCYDICRYHHEKWDGLGYPDGLAGDEIPIWAQVVSLADCYDALTSKRPYKNAYSHEQAADMIRDGACGAFSDELMECFGKVLPKFKVLAQQYADKAVKNNKAQQFVREQKDHSKDVYLKMSRDDLIALIEHQKELLRETHQRDVQVFYASSDAVFEFDLLHDTVHERKGSLESICGYLPKNYEEAVKLLSEQCAEEYRNRFLRTFRPDGMGKQGAVLECMMKLHGEDYANVRCSAIPVWEDGRMTRIFAGIIELHETALNSLQQTAKDHDVITGLWNLSGVKREIDDYLHHTGKNGYHLMILVDGDDFKSINRRTSYKFGNEILMDMAKELRKQVPDSAILGRIEDDNFLLFVKDCPDKEECMEVVEEVFRAYRQHYRFNDEISIDTTASVGAAMYPRDGTDFDTLFANVSKTVELVKLNGKNMYLFYHAEMEDDLKISVSSDLSLPESHLRTDQAEAYFIPVIHSGSGRILSYDFIETMGEEEHSTAAGLNTLRRLIGEICLMQQQKMALPKLSLLTVLSDSDCEMFVSVLGEIVKKYSLDCRNITLMLPQSLLIGMEDNRLTAFCAALKSMGFGLGVYDFGEGSFYIKCFSDSFFDRVVLAGSFLKETAEGVYPTELTAYFISYFDKLGISAELPSGVSDELIGMICQKTPVPFGVRKKEWISPEEFRKQMEISAAVVEYPVLSHENTSLVLSERVYDEVLEQTRSFIMEWTPRFDKVRISGSFRKLYGYEPVTEDFIGELSKNQFLHAEDIAKFLEKIHAVRYEQGNGEAFIRVYSSRTRSYVWNKVRFAAIRNSVHIPVKVIAVFADVSDESESFLHEQRLDRTDFITNLYNKRAMENKIKSCLYEEGSHKAHSLMIAEIGGYEALEEQFGTAFANAVLKETAENIRELFRDSDIIGRSSGSRFLIFIRGMGSGEKLREKAEQVCMVIKNQYHSENETIRIFGKAGVSVFPQDGTTYDELYSRALDALDVARHSAGQDIAFAADRVGKKLLHE